MEIGLIERISFVVIVLILLIILGKYKFEKFKKKRALKKRFKRGSAKEKEAIEYLENKNYKIIGKEKVYHHNYLVNGVTKSSILRVDFIVKKKNKIYIVEVKSGEEAIDPTTLSTRRQVLEYDFVIENDGVFVLDMENEKMQLVEFRSKTEKKDSVLRSVIIFVAIVGVAVPFWEFKIVIGLILLAMWKWPKTVKEVVGVFYKSK